VDGDFCSVDIEHDLWLLAEQDCDLDQTTDTDTEKLFELRAVRQHTGDVPSNIVGTRVRIDEHCCLNAMDHTTKVTAAWLTANIKKRQNIPAQRRRYVKTWLGYRYDRPAVPKQFVKAHERIRNLAKLERGKPDPQKPEQKKENREKVNLEKLRDVFVSYEELDSSGKVRCSLNAITKHVDDIAEIEQWMERIRDAVEDAEALIIVEVIVADPENTPISLLEKAFSIYADAHSLETAT
jgi:hypothetical protein